MKEGTVSRGVALRPRPTEVQPHFLGSNYFFFPLKKKKLIGFFLIIKFVTFIY